MVSVTRSMECPIIKKNTCTLFFRNLVRKSEERRLLGRSMHRLEDNIKMDLKEIGCNGVDWIYLLQNKVPLVTIVSAVS
jgi:hypothetical protein